MAIWINPPENYVFWSWENDSGDGPNDEWDNPEEALDDLRKAGKLLPWEGRWLYKGQWNGKQYKKLEEEYVEGWKL